MEIKPINLKSIDEKTANVYEAVIVASKEARRINEETRLEYNTLMTTLPSKGIEDDSEDVENPDQLKISLDFEKRPKPHQQALYKLLDGKLEYYYKEK